jgi:succinoglycan biosynthesis transport protein ExoP
MRFLRQVGLVGVATLIGMALAYLQFAKQAAEYESTALIAVRMPDDRQDDATTKTNTTALKSEGAWYDELMRSPLMIEQAITENQLTSLACLRDAAKPVDALLSRLAVHPLDPAGLTVELSFVATRPDDAEQVLKALLKTYGTILGDASGNTTAATLALLKQARNELLEQVSRKEKALAEFRATMPKDWPGRSVLAERRTRLDQLELRADDLAQTIMQLRNRLAAAKSAKDDGDQAALTKLMRPEPPPTPKNEPTVAQAKPAGAQLFDLLAEEAELLEKFGERHPKVRAVRARIEALKPEAGGETPLSKLQAEQRILLESYGPDHPKVRETRAKIAALTDPDSNDSEVPTASPKKTPDAVEPATPATTGSDAGARYITSLGKELTAREEEAKELAAMLVERRQELRKWSEWELGDDNLDQDLERTRRLFDTVAKRLEDTVKPKEAQETGFVVLSAPKPGELVRRSPVTTVLIGGGCGAALGLLLTLAQSRVRSGNVKVAGSLPNNAVPILTHLPAPDVAGQHSDGRIHPALQVYHQPQTAAAEAYRALRAVVHFRGGQVGGRNFGLLDASEGDASLIIAANLAASFALSGRRTLLIDCGAGRLRATKFFAAKAPENLDDALHERRELADALVTTEIDGLNVAEWRMGSPRADGPQNLHAIQAFQDKYDVTIVRLPAATSEALVTASSLIDCVVLLTPPAMSTDALVLGTERMREIPSTRILGAVVYGTAMKAESGVR